MSVSSKKGKLDEKKGFYGPGDLAVFNKDGKFGNENDILFHVHAVRYGVCNNETKKQIWYAGYLLEIAEYESEGLPEVPVLYTTITNASENQLKFLKHLKICFNPYK